MAAPLGDHQLDHAPFSIDHPIWIFGLKRLGLSNLQPDHDLSFERAQGYERSREIGADIFHAGRVRPVTIVQQAAVVDVTLDQYQTRGGQFLPQVDRHLTEHQAGRPERIGGEDQSPGSQAFVQPRAEVL